MGEKEFAPVQSPAAPQEARRLGLWIGCLWLAACGSVRLTEDPNSRSSLGEEAVAIASSVNPAAAPQAVPPLPRAGEYRIGPEVRAELEGRLERYVKRPRVSVSVREFLSQLPHVYVGGGVQTPGAYELRAPRDSFLDAVFAAGGVTLDADLSLSFVIRGAEVIASDFERSLRQGTRGGSNFGMADRELVYFPRKDFRNVYVLGQVRTPGAVPALEPMKLLEAVALAGGLMAAAYRPDVKVIRGGLRSGSALSVDFGRLEQGDLENNVTVYPGGVVFAPRSLLRAWNEVLEELTPSLNTLLLVEILQDER